MAQSGSVPEWGGDTPDGRRAPLLTAALTALALACSNSPTAPDGVTLQTDYGLVGVWTDGSTYDAGKLRASLERGQRRALAQRVDVPTLQGLTVAIYRRQVWPGVESVGAYDQDEDTVFALAGVEEVVDHELQHRAAWELGHRGECYFKQDHSPGFDLWCKERR